MLCQKLVYNKYNNKTNVLLGIVTGEDTTFVFFKTKNKSYRINKTSIISLEDTNEEFKEE